MITVSLCMIVKNEEDVLARCLDCAKQVVDEIIIVDTGSEDATIEIAKKYTEHVYEFTWCDDFSKARNEAFSKATMDYCMWLDADDVLLEEDIKKLQELKQRLDSKVNIVMMKYHTSFDEDGHPTFTYYRERWIRRLDQVKWQGAIHEVIPLVGNLQYEDIAITHRKLHPSDPFRNLTLFERRIKQGITLDAREQFYYARELYYHQRYTEAITQLEDFLNQKQGWIENCIDACELLGYCYYACHQEDNALLSLYRSFVYDMPRAELCCDIGKHYFDRAMYHHAIYWYERALNCTRKDERGGFVREDCYGYIPCLQLCVCWYHLQDIDRAIFYNEQAGYYKQSNTVKENAVFFQKWKKQEDT